MMDIKEIIKWFLPCFHILLANIKVLKDSRLTLLFVILLFNLSSSNGAEVFSDSDLSSNSTKSLVNDSLVLNENNVQQNQSAVLLTENAVEKSSDVFEETSVGRTFGRPLKKMMSALIPLVFQLGMAATWAVVAALVGIKTLGVALLILKLLLLAGALKAGALFGSKGHHQPSHGWAPPHQKEIHLHIHNGQLGHEEHYPVSEAWSRDSGTVPLDTSNTKNINVVLDPYSGVSAVSGMSGGPQTISTPFGNYVKLPPDTNFT